MNADYDIEHVENIPHIDYTLSKDKLWKLASINNPTFKLRGFKRRNRQIRYHYQDPSFYQTYLCGIINNRLAMTKNSGLRSRVGHSLWFWWEQTGSIKEANYEFKIDVSEEQNVKKDVENKLNQSLEEFKNNHRQVRFFEDEALKESEEILRQAKISYEEGAIDYVEYLQVITVVYDTKIQYINSIYNYQNSILKLENLIAGELK